MQRSDESPLSLDAPAGGRGWEGLALRVAGASPFPREGTDFPGDFASLGRAATVIEQEAPRVTSVALDRRTTSRAEFVEFVRQLGARASERPSEKAPRLSIVPQGDQETAGDGLLIYVLGAWLGEWLSWQAQAKWRVSGLVAPLSSAEPLLCRGGVACVNPFAWARQLLHSDDVTAASCHPQEHAHWPRCLPPRLLVAADLDAAEAARFVLPEPARRAMEIEELIGDAETAWPLYRHAYTQEPQNLPLLARMVACAWRLGRWETVDRLSRVILSQVPDHPQTNHNLAVLYSGPLHRPKTRKEAIRLLRRAIAADPAYARAYLTLASCLVEDGQFAEAIEQARRAARLSRKLVSQVEELLGALGESLEN